MFPTFTIGQVSKELDVSCHTLRFWEKELGEVLVPLRTNGGQRRYTTKHVETIKEIKRLRNSGLSLAQIKAKMGNQGSPRNSRKSDIVDRVAREIAEMVRLALNSLLEKKEINES